MLSLFRASIAESPGDRICHRVVLAAVLNGLGRSYLECSSAEGSSVGTDNQPNPIRAGSPSGPG